MPGDEPEACQPLLPELDAAGDALVVNDGPTARSGGQRLGEPVRLSPELPEPQTNQETVDGILIQIQETELTIVGEQPGQLQRRRGYEVKIAIPDWDKNRALLNSVRKGYLAQQKLPAKLQGDGASRPWLNQRFVEIDKAMAASFTTVAERIKTRRWRG